MLKNYFKTFLLIGMLFIDAKAVNAPSKESDLVDISEYLTGNELGVIEDNQKTVCLTADVVRALNMVEMQEESALKDLKDHICLGYRIAPYDETLEAINHAIKVCSTGSSNLSLDALCSYKQMMESGDMTLMPEGMSSRKSCKAKKYDKICVNSIAASGCELLINGNVRICGALNTTGGIGTPPCNPDATPISFNAPITTCGNIVFNNVTTSNPLNVVGNPIEIRIATLREVIGFTGSAITVAIDNAAGVPNLGGNIVLGGTMPTASMLFGAGVNLNSSLAPRQAVNVSFLNSLDISGGVGNLTLQLPVLFNTALYHDTPTVEVTASINNLDALLANVAGTTTLSITDVVVSVSNVTNMGMTLNITVVPLGGGTFADIGALQTALAAVLNGLFNDNLRLNIWTAGHDI